MEMLEKGVFSTFVDNIGGMHKQLHPHHPFFTV
jgi:hypothetical protein